VKNNSLHSPWRDPKPFNGPVRLKKSDSGNGDPYRYKVSILNGLLNQSILETMIEHCRETYGHGNTVKTLPDINAMWITNVNSEFGNMNEFCFRSPYHQIEFILKFSGFEYSS